MTAPRVLHWDYLGRLPYRAATDLQIEARRRVLEDPGNERLFLLEHPHVFTLGRSADRGDILATDAWLRQRGVAVEQCDRGGQVTYHGPGQLVGYPIVDLSPDRRDVRRYVRDLQEVLIRLLADHGIEARGGGEQARIGVWVGGAKIASIGVHLSRWVTTHGFALNVSPDLEYFAAIVPCGLRDVRMTSVERLTGRRLDPSELAAGCAEHFGRVFDRRPVRTDLRAGQKQAPGALTGWDQTVGSAVATPSAPGVKRGEVDPP